MSAFICSDKHIATIAVAFGTMQAFELTKKRKYWTFHAPDGWTYDFSHLDWAKHEARKLGAIIGEPQ